MPRSGGAVVLAVVLALAGAASAGVSAIASAATKSTTRGSDDTITVANAIATAVPGGEQLSVTAESTTALASMTLHLLGATAGLDLTMNPPAGGTAPGSSTWTSDVITTSVLPLGTYNVTADAADAGTSVTALAAGTFAFQETPTITVNPVPVVSFAHQTPTVSGTVTTTGPGSTASGYYGNAPVFIAYPDLPGGGVTVHTDQFGRYSYTFTDPLPGKSFTVEVPGTSAVAAASVPPAAFTFQTQALAMSATLSAKTVTYGTTVTVGGTVTYKPGSTPVQGVAVQVFSNKSVAVPVAKAVTGRNGHFTATLPKEAASVHWVLQASGPYLTTAAVTVPMKVNLPTVISGFQASLSQFWRLSVRGCLALPAGVPRSIPSLSGLVIQYAAGPAGPWHKLGALAKRSSVPCGNGGRLFSGTLTARLNYAYYRAWYAGSTDSAGTGFLACASGRVLAWKYEDRITALRVSSRTVPKGGKLTVSGQLQYFSGKWRDYAGQHVYVILRPKGSSTWYYIVAASTGSAGRFSATFTDPVTATWSAEFLGNSTHLAALAALIDVRVT